MNILQKNYEHIIWDWNGTLFDDARLTLSIMNGMLSKRQIGWDFDVYAFEDLSDEYIEEYYRRHFECPLRAGAEKILRGNKVPQSILTASKQSDIDLLVKHFGLDKLFVGVNGLDNHHAAGKLEIGGKWVDELDLRPENILMVGDTTHDAVLAKELGMDSVLIVSGHQSKTRLEKCGVPVIHDLKELL